VAGGENAAPDRAVRYALLLLPDVSFSLGSFAVPSPGHGKADGNPLPIWEIEDCADSGTRLYQLCSMLLNSERAGIQSKKTRGLMMNESRDGENTLLLWERRLLPGPV
jgi:hypothetical protein